MSLQLLPDPAAIARAAELIESADAIIIAAGAGMGDVFYIGNLGEVILGFANVYTAKKFLS